MPQARPGPRQHAPEVVITQVRGGRLPAAVVATVLALSGAAAATSTAGAAGNDDDPDGGSGGQLAIVVTVPDGGPGRLVLSVADHGSAVILEAAGDGGDRLRFDGALPVLTVTDSRRSEEAGGWSVAGQAADFTSSAGTITADHLGWTPQVLTPRDGVAAGGRVATVLSDGPGLAAPATLGSADSADSAGRGQATRLTADLLLEVPVDTGAGTYHGVVTVSLFPVD